MLVVLYLFSVDSESAEYDDSFKMTDEVRFLDL